MKILAYILGGLVTLLVALYVVIFTPFGNGILKPVVVSQIQKNLKLDAKLQTFRLGWSVLEIVLDLNKENRVTLKGEYSLFSQTFHIDYDVMLQHLNTLQPLTQTPLNGKFFTQGSVEGDLHFIKVNGLSDLAKSQTSYHVELKEFNPTSIIAKVKDGDLKTLLYMINQKSYASADINLDINFKNIKPHQLDGDVMLVTRRGLLNSKVFKKDFNVTIPKTAFNMNLDAKLKGDAVDYTYNLYSNLAKIALGGNVVPQPFHINTHYDFKVKELAVLKPISGADIRGKLQLSGKIKGDKKKMLIDGHSDIASSKTTFSAILQDFQPKSAEAHVRGLKIQKLLYMVKQPHYTDGLFDMDMRLSDVNVKHLKGKIDTKVRDGLLDSKYLTKAFAFESRMPRTKFNVVTNSILEGSTVDTKITLNSTLADLRVKNAHFNIKDTSLQSDYKVKVKDLNKLYFVTQRALKGQFEANGVLKKAKDLDFTMHSAIAQGALDAKLHNDDFHADINGLQTLDILDILLYPKVFKSNIDGVLDYNLAKSAGEFHGKLNHGKFTKNQVFDLTKKYAHIDLYKELFKGDVDAKINKEKILASLDLKSNKSSITTRNTKLDTKTKYINSKIDINANGNPLSVKLSGNIEKPKVQVDASKIIKKEATKAIEKEIEKRYGKDVKEKVNSFLKGLF